MRPRSEKPVTVCRDRAFFCLLKQWLVAQGIEKERKQRKKALFEQFFVTHHRYYLTHYLRRKIDGIPSNLLLGISMDFYYFVWFPPFIVA